MSLAAWIVASSVAFGFILIGGAGYEHLVVDLAWPQRPDLIQPARGGLLRRRFWMPAHGLFELSLLIGLVFAWSHNARLPLMIALLAQLLQRIWSFADFIPKAARFEEMEPSEIVLAEAQRWVKRSLLRLPFSLAAAASAFCALAVLVGTPR